MTRRLIFVTRRPPFPLDNGARIRAHRLAAGLSRRFDLTLVTFADGPRHDDAPWSPEDLAAILPDARLHFVPYGRPHPRGLRRNLLRPGSADLAAYDTPTLRKALRALAKDAVLHLDDPGVALAGLGAPAALRVCSTHNVEHRIVADLARARPLHQRIPLEAEWRKIAREERSVWAGCDLTLACSELDARVMRALGAGRVEVCPNGTDPVEPLPPAPAASGEPLRLLFVGAGDFWPYELGLAWFVREALPSLRADGPVALDVVGAPPHEPVHADGVVYHGRVPDVRPFYERAHALVIPVFQGSGTRLKAIEAGALARPVISTALGVEGLPLRPHESYLRAEDAEGFAAAARALRAGWPAAMVAAARTAAESFFWPAITARLADLYAEEARGRTS